MFRIAIDMDGVLVNTQPRISKLFNEMFGTDIDSEMTLNFDLKSLFCISEEEELALFEQVFASNEGLYPIKGSIEACNLLKEAGFDLIVTTARHSTSITNEWLKKYNIYNKLSGVYYNVNKNKDKIPSFDYMIDDSPRKIANLYSLCKKQAFLLRNPQNAFSRDVRNRYISVKNWDEFLNKISRMHPDIF